MHRSICWYAGLACVAAGMIGPLDAAAYSSFTAHMAAHLLVGMLAPLLLVLAAPLTLLLRALSTSNARALSRLMSTRFIRAISHPVTAALLNAGGLWLLYTTDLFLLMHSSPAAHVAVHAHILLAGYLFTASLVSIDPNPHRASMMVRSAVLIVFIAAHSILAKWLYAHPPAGVDAADAQAGAQLMYYGGDAVDLVIIVLLLSGWYRATRLRPSGVAHASERGRAA